MFRNRNSQKPTEDFLAKFQASFPNLRTSSSASEGEAAGQQQNPGPLTQALDVAQQNSRSFDDNALQHQDFKVDADPTPRGSNEPWQYPSTGLTPSILDVDSHAFNSFAAQMPGYYTPTPGGTNTLYHSHHAGDLHTPGFSMGFGTPLSMPNSEHTMQMTTQPTISMQQFHAHQQMPQMPQMQHQQMHAQQFQQSMNPFQMHNQQTFAPQDYHQVQHPQMPATFQHMDSRSTDPSSMEDMAMDLGVQNASPDTMMPPDVFHHDSASTKITHPLMEKFRYHTTLNAPTAMVKTADEIPITYLNKGQAYTLTVNDTAPQHSTVGQLKYRTFVRISFEEEDQRKKPGACWQLWKEGRGTNEAHQRGGRLQAVEFVDPAQMAGPSEAPSKANIELESSSFDGFCVTWSPAANGSIECGIPVRFNFLSTDFSHSKGVKGIPVRLCSRTELLLDSMSPKPLQQPTHEVCYCKVKLFRDHGAERKLSNDTQHIKKTIDKLQQQLAQIESGMRDLGKRKRSSAGMDSNRPGKVPKHKRTWSVSSGNSSGAKNSAEDDLQIKLMNLHHMFSSTRPFSVMFLRGAPEDDPDLFPVRLGSDAADGTKMETVETGNVWDKQSIHSSIVSPTPSSRSVMSTRRDSHFQHFGPPSRVSSNDWRNQQQTATMDLQSSNPQHLASPPDQPMKVGISSPTSGTLSGWIEALGVDANYQPPAERAVKPVASFFVQPRIAGEPSKDPFYRAIYVMQRTLRDFVNAVAFKSNIEPTRVLRVVRVSRKGLHVLLDDEAIHEMAEGQDMTAEFCPVDAPGSPIKTSKQWDAGNNDIQVDGDLATLHDRPSAGYELKLLY